ncbi:DNA alkylation repair protein [Piscinibacter gummiphilus]|uniref:DNA alkylation repair protein n=1 Tax=Piscinibacter gummiphilus TaxID=946333 RepID=A0ABZ0CYR9_9BURK|nr:DNA alkylation repair protein [Piscinibacter gummiphilus]WOB10132.1 DNA alkylation repair protein [Piscinibacter gummiphilus]
MPEPFKNLLGPQVAAAMASHLQRAGAETGAAFNAKRFRSLALSGLEALEMKARAQHLCTALEKTLPSDFDSAATVMEGALASMGEIDDATLDSPSGARDDGLAGWAVWPLTEYVARHGKDKAPRALQALHAMTQRFTAEWAIRPFILAEPALSFDTLQRWSTDASPHVRRLVSEGSRPRLPWGMVLKPLVDDPSPTLPLLRRLMDDASPYVRRSVANHLNDIAKDHPYLIEAWLQEHLPTATPARLALLRHASRTLVKKGHAGVLKAFGVGDRFKGEASVALSSRRATVGDSLQLALTLQSTARKPQRLAIDYAVHHVKANGDTSPKVFKGWVVELAAGERREFRKQHSLRPITTRVYYPGPHRIEVLVNGAAVAEAGFELRT